MSKKVANVPKQVLALIEKRGGIALDVGCGANKQKNFVGMDLRKLPGVDIVHNLEVFPYPLPDECCYTVIGSHIYEHINPQLSLKFIDELWRVLKDGGKLALAMPYGVGNNYMQDPTHCNPSNFSTWQYFDPRFPLWDVYRPKTWKIEVGFPAYQMEGNMEIVLEKVNYGKLTEGEIIKLRREYWEGRR